MYTNNDYNIVATIRSHLEKGDCYFELYFAEQIMDQQRLNTIFEGFCGVSLPENMKVKLNFSSSGMEDEIAKVLADKLSTINWPSKVNFDLMLRNNSLTDEAANSFVDLCNKFDNIPGARVSIDLDNNTGLTADIICDTLKKIDYSFINGKVITNKDNNRKIEFSYYLIDEYASIDHESDEF